MQAVALLAGGGECRLGGAQLRGLHARCARAARRDTRSAPPCAGSASALWRFSASRRSRPASSSSTEARAWTWGIGRRRAVGVARRLELVSGARNGDAPRNEQRATQARARQPRRIPSRVISPSCPVLPAASCTLWFDLGRGALHARVLGERPGILRVDLRLLGEDTRVGRILRAASPARRGRACTARASVRAAPSLTATGWACDTAAAGGIDLLDGGGVLLQAARPSASAIGSDAL